jgi:hypothetical protein
MQINEKWLCFGYYSKKQAVNTPVKFPIAKDLEMDEEFTIPLFGQSYTFQCKKITYSPNEDGTMDVIYTVTTSAI